MIMTLDLLLSLYFYKIAFSGIIKLNDYVKTLDFALVSIHYYRSLSYYGKNKKKIMGT